MVAGLAGAALAFGVAVAGAPVDRVTVDGQDTAWNELEHAREPGHVTVRIRTSEPDGAAIEVPPCAGRGDITRDGEAVPAPTTGPAVIPLSAGPHVVAFEINVSTYERRVACGYAPRVGPSAPAKDGLATLTFASPRAASGGGRAVVFVPPNHDAKKPSAVLVGAHPWNGSIWTYASYAELLDEAAKRDVVLLMPSGLGNSLYTAPAEDEVVRAIDALASVIAVDPLRVSLWGASMGGAGATTIGFHRPDHFASVTSFFGDSKYDLKTYVKAILRDEAGAHLVNALDVADNARNLPVWLIHGEDDRVSDVAQSDLLASALRGRQFRVRFDRVPHFGHAGALVAKFIRDVVARASEAQVPSPPRRVSYVSVRPSDLGAYGIHIERDGESSIDLARDDGGNVHVLEARRVKSITLDPGALGAATGARIVIDDHAASHVRVAWKGWQTHVPL